MNQEEPNKQAINKNIIQLAQDMLSAVKTRWLDVKPLEFYPAFMALKP